MWDVKYINIVRVSQSLKDNKNEEQENSSLVERLPLDWKEVVDKWKKGIFRKRWAGAGVMSQWKSVCLACGWSRTDCGSTPYGPQNQEQFVA